MAISALWLASELRAGDPQASFPKPPPASDQQAAQFGVNIQRTMNLLASSTPEHRHKVRILFYGQSITEQNWWKLVAEDLRKRFPSADLEIDNRAIGGFAAQMLILPAEHDLYPFYPDLLIFHVYGSNKEYEEIVKSARSRTTAEVLMQTDHLTSWPPAVIDPDKDKGAWWDNLMNKELLPGIAKKYGCGLADNRSQWFDYLKANKLEPKSLLVDGVHLNDHGNFLMAELVKRYLVLRPDLPSDNWRDTVRTLVIGKDVAWKDGQLVLEFEGNRVDLIAAKAGDRKPVAARVLIDGKKPSEFPGNYRITRAQPGPWSPATVVRVDHDKPLQVEDWALKVTSVKDNSSAWEFDVTGSKTGSDGHGSSDKAFVSKSGRVKIEPGAWFHPQKNKVPVGYEIKWKVLPMFVDVYEAPPISEPGREYTTTLAQGLPNAKHKLEIIAEGDGVVPIQAIRVYRPPVK
jgi:hypothetical protein